MKPDRMTPPSSGPTDDRTDRSNLCQSLFQRAVFLFTVWSFFHADRIRFDTRPYFVPQKAVLLRRHNTQHKKHFEHVA